jgi:hypothetical protein
MGTPLPPLRILLSYWYYKDHDLDEVLPRTFSHGIPPIFADSGAFSAMTQGVKISLAEYAAWLQRYQHHFTVYANLDVIRHPDLTWMHQQQLEQEYGLTPLPVFHVATAWEWLAHYLDRYPYIALGVAGHPYRSYMGWLVRCFQEAQGRAVYHGFGITAWTPWRAFPWYSVDSSSWGQGFRYGQIPLFLPERGCFGKIALGDRAGVYRYARQLRALGFDPEDFADRARNRRDKVCALSALSYLRAEQFLRDFHGPVVIPTRPDLGSTPGPVCFLSSTDPQRFVEVEAAMPPPEAGPQCLLANTSIGMTNVRRASAWLAVEASTRDTRDATGCHTFPSDTSNGINYAATAAGLRALQDLHTPGGTLYLADGAAKLDTQYVADALRAQQEEA